MASILRKGRDFTLVTYGTMLNEVLEAADLLAQSGMDAEVIKLNTIKPIDFDTIASSANRTGRLMIVEEQVQAGSVGAQVLAELALRGAGPQKSLLLNLGDQFIPHGSPAELLERYGLNAAHIAQSAHALR